MKTLISKNLRVVIGVIGNDVHVVSNRLLEIALKERGYTVFNLGVNIMPDEFMDAAVEINADMLIVSSINGEIETWIDSFYGFFTRYKDLITVIAGNLSLGDLNSNAIEKKSKNVGFKFIFHQVDINTGLNKIDNYLRSIL